MAEGLLLNIAEDLLKKLASTAVDEVASAWGFKTQVEKLHNTIDTLKNILIDAEQRQHRNLAIQGWLDRLKRVVYEADDLFDEVATMASRKQLRGGTKFTKEVKTFFSSSNQPAFAISISHKVKKIREKLSEIEADGNKFEFVQYRCEEPRVTQKDRSETHSFVDAQQVIGRDADKKAILDMLDQYQDQHVSVVPIVGMGGLGKTTLAQLVYNHYKDEKLFDLELWVCVSDNFDIKEIVRMILMSATNSEPPNLGLDQLQKKMQEQIIGKKYLLVLDDVWNDDREKWLKLSDLLSFGRDGSKILVTTRSWNVAKIMSTIPNPYALEVLTEEESWSLFRKVALEPEQEDKNPNLLNIGKEIVRKCGRLPLAIRVIGSFLYGKHESKWLSFKEISLFGGENDMITDILKFSYDHLWSSLKSCFAYCALFPKDYKFDKETLISLWMAQGFINPMDGSQSLEDAGEEYFLTLLQRCFFQDVTRDEWGNITGCKMHDLVHDLALKVAGIECKLAKAEETEFDKRILHMSLGYRLTASWKMSSHALKLPLLRTLTSTEIRDGSVLSKSICSQLLTSSRCLRVLDLHGLGVRSLPSSIGKLVHLRYLNLSQTPIEALPNAITKLHNLQTLDLHKCDDLRSLPADIFKKLTNLRSLDVRGTDWRLTLPSGIGQLTSLHKLTYFPVGSKKGTAKLSDLNNLNNLRGSLRIEISRVLKLTIHEAKEANLGSKSGLEELEIDFRLSSGDENCAEAVMEGLKPPPNLKKLRMHNFYRVKLPGWAVMDNLYTRLQNIVEIHLEGFTESEQVPTFSKLPLLRCLRLTGLGNVEYMESGDYLHEISVSSQQEPLFFPSLQQLELSSMFNLKGWWKEVEEVVSDEKKNVAIQLPKLHHVSKLRIQYCPKLKSMPFCPNVEELSVTGVDATTMSAPTPSYVSHSKLRSLCVNSVERVISFPKECLHHLSSLSIEYSALVSISELEQVFKSSYSLRHLDFRGCRYLRSLSGGLEYLSTLESLEIFGCDKLDLWENEEMEGGIGMPWKALSNLQTLKLSVIPKLVALPNGLQHLINLRLLRLTDNSQLKELPEWINRFSSLEQMSLNYCPQLTALPEGLRELTGLKKLEIVRCERLMERCRGPDGEDWPKIKHIPFTVLRTRDDDVW